MLSKFLSINLQWLLLLIISNIRQFYLLILFIILGAIWRNVIRGTIKGKAISFCRKTDRLCVCRKEVSIRYCNVYWLEIEKFTLGFTWATSRNRTDIGKLWRLMDNGTDTTSRPNLNDLVTRIPIVNEFIYESQRAGDSNINRQVFCMSLICYSILNRQKFTKENYSSTKIDNLTLFMRIGLVVSQKASKVQPLRFRWPASNF